MKPKGKYEERNNTEIAKETLSGMVDDGGTNVWIATHSLSS